MLEARNPRGLARVSAAVDIDAELARLVGAGDRRRPARRDPRAHDRRNIGRVRHGQPLLDVDAEVAGRWRSSDRHASAGGVEAKRAARPGRGLGLQRAMADPRRFELEDLVIRPGSYFNPQTEVLIVVDDAGARR